MKRWIVIAGVAAVILAAVTLIWFQPQKLFIDQTVDEAAPSAEVEPSATPSKQLQGTFESIAHPTKGRALVHEGSDGQLTLRFEDFETDNGPDLRVYLSAGEPYGEDFVDLGPLKGNIGSQNYEIPQGTDLARYKNAVVWCRRFTTGFGVAELS